MTIDLSVADQAELNAMVTETTGMDATAIAASILHEYLAPRISVRADGSAKARLAAFDAAASTVTKATILASVASVGKVGK